MAYSRPKHLSKEMESFLEHTYEVVMKSLERHLYQREEKNIRKREIDDSKVMSKKNHQMELTGPAKLRLILRNAKTNSRKLPVIKGLSEQISQHNPSSSYRNHE